MSGRWVGFYWTSAFNVYLIKHHRVVALVISILVYSTLSSLFAQFFSPTVKHYLPGFKHYWSSLSCSFRISFSKRFMHHGATEIKFILSKFNKFLKLPITPFFCYCCFLFPQEYCLSCPGWIFLYFYRFQAETILEDILRLLLISTES